MPARLDTLAWSDEKWAEKPGITVKIGRKTNRETNRDIEKQKQKKLYWLFHHKEPYGGAKKILPLANLW